MRKSFSILLLLCFFLSHPLQAQLYYFEKFDVEQGLSQVNINSLYEDDLGFLWIGTQGGGVCRFDGKVFTTYNEKDGIPGELVTSITQSSNQNIIVGSTWGGVAEFSEGRFKATNPVFSYSGTNHILTCKSTTWCASMSGLFWLNKRTLVKMKEEELQNQVINYMAQKDGLIYAISYNKIFVIDSDSRTILKSLNFNLPTESSIITINKNQVLVGTKGSGIFYTSLTNLTKLKNKEWITFEPIAFNVDSKVNFIYTDNSGQMWTSFNNQKLYNITNNSVIENKGFSFQTNANFTSMLIDRGGTIWLGTDAIGLLKIIDPIFINFSNVPQLNQPNIFSITTDEENNVWVGSRTNGIVAYHPTEGVIAQFNGKTNFPSLIHTLVRKNKIIYVGTDRGLYTINSKTKKADPSILFKGIEIKSVAIFDDGTIAAGSAGNGLFIRKPNGEMVDFTEKKGFIHNYIHSLLIDKTGRLWIGTGNGIAYMDMSHLKYKTLDNGQLCNSYIGCISQDKFDNIWFSTDRCLMKFDGMKIDQFDRKDGLYSNTLYFVKCDSKNNVWVGSNAGLDKLELGPYGKIEKISHFSMQDGFIGSECNTRAVHESGSGDMFFCTIRGLIKFIGEPESSNMCNHKVLVNGLGIFYSPAPFDQVEHGNLKKGTAIYENAIFSYHQNHLTFHFLCTEKCKPNDVSFSFKLENFDKKWSPAVKSNLATYSNLPAGEYTFKVKTLDKNNVPTGMVDTYHFTITAPFWMKTWFYIALIICFFGVLAYLKFRTEQREEFQRLQLEKKVNQRTIELTKQKEERELLLKEIHHRVKNNLQIINSLINLQAGQIKDAESLKVFEECKNRIKSMAIIHTKFYESSDFSKIDLAEYVQHLVKDLIHTYNVNKQIELQCNLHSHQMGIDTVIPVGLILNEIISNSLKYAFAKSDKGIIDISLTRDGVTGEYEMIIGDNGAGFDKSNFTQNNNDSLGFELIKILSEQLNGTVTILDRPGTYYKLIFKEIYRKTAPLGV